MGSIHSFPFRDRGNSFPFRRKETFGFENDITKVGHSGNSDVDIHMQVEMDTKPVAYAMLCSLLATKQLTNREFEQALNKFEDLIAKDQRRSEKKNDDLSSVKLFNPNRWEDNR